MPDPSEPAERSWVTTPPQGEPEPELPRLPVRAPSDEPPPFEVHSSGARVYRAESTRASLMRRVANPWWRRILRSVLLLAILAGMVIGGYFAVDALKGYLDRDRLPSPGVDSADVRSATYHVQSGPVDGGLTGDIAVDHASDTYRFQGAAETDLAGIEIVGDGAGNLALRRDGGAWELGWADERAQRLGGLATYLDVIDTDDLLTTTWRDGYAAIEDRQTDVTFADVVGTTMYAIDFDAARYATDHPFQWSEWVATVLPLPDALDDTLVTVWVDHDDVIRGFDNAAAQLRWERLTYSADPLTIEFPIT